MRFPRKPSILGLLVPLLLASKIGQAQQREKSHVPTFGVTSELVAIPVSVTDRKGQTVLGLRSEDFLVTENNVLQEVQSVSRWDVPVSICVVFDASGSMKQRIRTAQTAVRKLMDGSGPDDEACLIRFAGKVEVLVDFTDDTNQIANKLLWDRPRGATSLVDGLYAALIHMKRASNSRRAIVVITDAGENSSRYSFSELLSLAREADVQVYTVAIRGDLLDKQEQRGRLQLGQITEETGGKLLTIDSSSNLPRGLEAVNELIRNEYLLTYRPADSQQDGKWHPVRVRLQPASKASLYRVNSRRGYYATQK